MNCLLRAMPIATCQVARCILAGFFSRQDAISKHSCLDRDLPLPTQLTALDSIPHRHFADSSRAGGSLSLDHSNDLGGGLNG